MSTETMRDVVEEPQARSLRLGTHFDTREALRNAQKQAEERDLKRMLIVDVDAHHYETESWAEITDYLEDPVLQHLSRSSGMGKLNGSSSPLLTPQIGNQDIANGDYDIHWLEKYLATAD